VPEPAAVLGLGFALGISLAAPPGPILTFSAQRTVHHGFWPGMIVGVGAALGDGTYALLMGVGAVPLLASVEWLAIVLGLAGAVLLGWFAYGAWHSARQPPDVTRDVDLHRRGFLRLGLLPGGFVAGYVMALSSPFNFGWWVSVGTALFDDYGSLVFVGFFAGILAWMVFFTAVVLWLRAKVRGVIVVISYASALVLAGFAVYFLAVSLRDAAALWT